MLFAYGTLQFPSVLQALLGRVPSIAPASLAGWRAAALPGRIYPGLVAGGAARGVVIGGIQAGEWEVLDAFEGPEYGRQEVDLVDGRTAWTYIWLAADAAALHDWDATRFEREALATYVHGCRRWRSAFA